VQQQLVVEVVMALLVATLQVVTVDQVVLDFHLLLLDLHFFMLEEAVAAQQTALGELVVLASEEMVV
jgi:hypothetical protein